MILRILALCVFLCATGVTANAQTARFEDMKRISKKAAEGLGVEAPLVVLAKGPYGGEVNTTAPFENPNHADSQPSWGIFVGAHFLQNAGDEDFFIMSLTFACAKKKGHFEEGMILRGQADVARIDGCVWDTVGEDYFASYMRRAWAGAQMHMELLALSDEQFKAAIRKNLGR